MDLTPPPSDDPRALLAASDAARSHGAHRAGAAWAQQAAALAVQLGDDALAADALALVALHGVRLGDVEHAVASGQRALALLASVDLAGGAASSQDRRALLAMSRVHATLSMAYERAGLYSLAVSHGASALQSARDVGDLAAECWALNRLGTAAHGVGDMAAIADDASQGLDDRTGDPDDQASLDLLQRSLALARRVPDPAEARSAMLSAMNNLSRRWVLAADQCSGAAARQALQQALPLAESAAAMAADGRSGFLVATAACNLGGIHRRLGDIARARDHFQQALDLCRQHGYGGLQATVVLALASIDFETAPGPVTQQALAALLDQPDRGADPDLRLRARQQLVQGCRARGDLATAFDQLDRLRVEQLAAQTQRADLQTRLLFNRTQLEQARHDAESARLDAELQSLRADAEHRAAQQLASDRDLLEREVAARTADLQRAMATAEAGSRAKSEFLSIVSHELQTPLHGILGLLSLARRRATDARQAEQLAMAEVTGRRLGALFDHILAYVDADGRPPGAAALADLRGLLAAVRAGHDMAACAKGLGLVLQVDDAVPARLPLDGPRLSRILDVLVDNAVKFSHAGTVRLSAHWQPPGTAPGWLRVDVTDDGPGIDAHTMQRLFRPFELGDASLGRLHGGLGLGLALARRLAQSLGGDVGVDNHQPRGCTFWVSMPVAESVTVSKSGIA